MAVSEVDRLKIERAREAIRNLDRALAALKEISKDSYLMFASGVMFNRNIEKTAATIRATLASAFPDPPALTALRLAKATEFSTVVDSEKLKDKSGRQALRMLFETSVAESKDAIAFAKGELDKRIAALEPAPAARPPEPAAAPSKPVENPPVASKEPGPPDLSFDKSIKIKVPGLEIDVVPYARWLKRKLGW